MAVVPRSEVVVSPDDGVEEVHEVQKDHPENETGCGYVVVSRMPDKRRQIEDD